MADEADLNDHPHSARGAEAATADAGATVPVASRGHPLLENLRFPGCRPLPLLRDRFDDFDERLEHWDAGSETVWVVAETPGGIHEGTSRRLPQLAERIALVRGAPIVALGAVGLVERDAAGAPVRAMQADETLYLHPDRAVLPEGSLIIGGHDLPDVVLEVDYTTDIRPGKLRVYERWGFPELWAVVPDGASRRRPAGLTIYRLVGGRYRSTAASAALPGWTSAEIHAALTERVPSARTDRVLERVGRTLGAREGTRPENTPLIHALNEHAYAAGRAAGRNTELAATVRSVLQARGIRLREPPVAAPAPFGGASRDDVTAAAVACEDEADFWRRLGVAPP